MKTESVIQQLHDWFPNFEIEKDDWDLPTVVFAFFSTYIKDSINSRDTILIQRIIVYLGGLINTDNSVIESCLDEIALGLDEQREAFLNLIKPVNYKLYERLKKTIELWNSV
jgi:hypothetical protein